VLDDFTVGSTIFVALGLVFSLFNSSPSEFSYGIVSYYLATGVFNTVLEYFVFPYWPYLGMPNTQDSTYRLDFLKFDPNCAVY